MMVLMSRAALVVFAAVLLGPLASAQAYTFVPNLAYGAYVGGGGATLTSLVLALNFS